VYAFRAFLFPAMILGLALAGIEAAAQTDIAPELRDRPPVAAPTSKIEVGAISVVLSGSQEADNFASGVMSGLMVGTRVKGIALVAVQEDHVIVQRAVGTLTPNTQIPIGSLSRVFAAIGAVQQIERGRLMPDSDIAMALGESGTRGMTLSQVLSFQAGDPSLVRQLVEKASGMSMDEYTAKEILQPLGMRVSRMQNGEVETTLVDMSHLAIALVHDGAFETGRILQQPSVERMQEIRYAPHPALPGVAYGFTEMRRNGWSGLQHDGTGPRFESRLVVVPEAKIAYFIAVEGQAGAEFWRTLDNGFFDKLFPPRNSPAQAPPGAAPPPGPAEASRVAGLYEPVRDVLGSIAPLKRGAVLRVRALSEGSLALTGDEKATLAPRPGGYWESGDRNVAAMARDGKLILSGGAYGPLAFYKRPEFYALLALLAAFAAGGLIWRQRRSKSVPPYFSDPVLGAAGISAAFVLLSIFVWLFSPAV
jgi:CubicO group peptidase (beta-lactamase class C family)